MAVRRLTADDLQNVLNSTDIATNFLDASFIVRLFTPAAKALLQITAEDVGRPLADLQLLALDASLLTDACGVA
jgi:two-component system CheB/CheR fusion protein